ncbi:MAG: TrmH family RNA methyltransferase [Promethearchaeota archaeon]
MTIDVLLIGTKTSENVGFIARAMMNFGLKKLMMINPRCQIDKHAFGCAMHAKPILNNAIILSNDGITNADKLLADVGSKYDLVIGSTGKSPNRKKLHRVPITPREMASYLDNKEVLLVFGREDNGLTDAEIRACDLIDTIPANSSCGSLNVSHAATSLFYEICLNKKK